MEYSVSHISLLIDLMLVEADLPRNKTGLKELVARLEDKRNKKANVSYDYLYRRHLDVKDCITHGKAKLRCNQEFIEDCASFLLYDTYKDFSNRVNTIQTAVDQWSDDELKLVLFLPEELKHTIIGDIEVAQKEDQNIQFIHEVYDAKRDDWTNNVLNQDQSMIWFIPPFLFEEEREALLSFLLKHKENLKRVLPFFLISKEKELDALKAELKDESLMGSEGDLRILVQVLIQIQKKESHRNSKPKEELANQKQDSIIIHTGGGIGIGKIKTKKFNQTTNNYNSK